VTYESYGFETSLRLQYCNSSSRLVSTLCIQANIPIATRDALYEKMLEHIRTHMETRPLLTPIIHQSSFFIAVFGHTPYINII